MGSQWAPQFPLQHYPVQLLSDRWYSRHNSLQVVRDALGMNVSTSKNMRWVCNMIFGHTSWKLFGLLLFHLKVILTKIH